MTAESQLNKRSAFDRLLDLICQVNIIITGIMLVVLTVIFGWLVFGRYVLNATPTWVEQVALLLIVYIGFLGASVGIHKQTHLGVAVFREMSPPPVQLLFDFIAQLTMAVFGLVMAIYGYQLTVFKWATQIPLIHISEGFRSLPISVSGVFIFLFSIGHLIHFFQKKDID
jgi:TRAP-type transport system small permease protein